MAKRKSKSTTKEEKSPPPAGPRPFWSGTISFALVSVPVSLFPAYRQLRKGLRMLDRDGTPLSRRFYCLEHQREVHAEHILRGYPVDEGEYVIVRDEELEALAPEKSRDIDLTKFVPRDQLPPSLFDRAYFLTPDGDSNKAYRLLVNVMQELERVGIATFVMRGKEYLIAIIAENSMLRAETLRFQDELRTPEDAGLSEVDEPAKSAVTKFEQAIKHHRGGKFDPGALEEESTKRLLKLVESKFRQNTDVVTAGDAAADEDGEPHVDLLDVIRRSMQQEMPSGNGKSTHDGESYSGKARSKKSHDGKSSGNAPRTDVSKQELYDQAQELDIPGRSQMSKEELARAIRKARS